LISGLLHQQGGTTVPTSPELTGSHRVSPKTKISPGGTTVPTSPELTGSHWAVTKTKINYTVVDSGNGLLLVLLMELETLDVFHVILAAKLS
jgi:hypothetical protein